MSHVHPRIYLLQRLREELLGPRSGASETLSLATDPREEYTTGVLDVYHDDLSEEIELEMLEAEELDAAGSTVAEDEEEDDPLRRAADFAPSVDPRRLPRSIGLSFLLEGSAESCVRVAVSCGRYGLSADCWQRYSYAFEQTVTLTTDNQRYDFPTAGVRLLVRTKESGPARFRVSLFLINTGGWERQSGQRASALLYQPQIRVLTTKGTALNGLAGNHGGMLDSDETSLQLLYRNLPAKGRGHLCAAVWQEIDIEQVDASPFGWVDVIEPLREFTRCSLRTELLPALAVPTPSMDWRDEYGPEPVREAAKLAEMWEPEALGEALRPLAEGYERWWRDRETEAAHLPPTFAEQANRHAQQGRESLKRMDLGIKILIEDQQARLAFNFANRAVLEQASWLGGRPLKWRPFQLGFMLQCLPGLTDPESPERELCDLLWFPTGGGKTEAYLGLTAYVLALRRLRHQGYDGTGVISRYTLRLLAIQQFRRALKLITACEMLRVTSTSRGVGWRPERYPGGEDWLWGKHRFSTGLWLGGAVTPNSLRSVGYPRIKGAFDLLKSDGGGEGEPAQVTECPVCGTALALAKGEETGVASETTIFLRVEGVELEPGAEALSTSYIEVKRYQVHPLTTRLQCIEITLKTTDARPLSPGLLDEWWEIVRRAFGEQCVHLCCRASRPGYFIQQYHGARGASYDWRIETACPSPHCPTAKTVWREELPVPTGGQGGGWQPVHPAFAHADDITAGLSCPIPAVTVDDQIYAWPPSLIVSTVDKFARLAFEPRASSMFGNVEHYHPHEGFYRENCTRLQPNAAHPPAAKDSIAHAALPPPDLILQDELHLIDGPLGSMVGLYETIVDTLCGSGGRVKYIASTATVRAAEDQVRSLFARELRQFPPPGLDAHDSFFALMSPPDPLMTKGSGRLYLGYCAPGRGALTPLVRVWSVLLQAVWELKEHGVDDEQLDPYWTPVGYFTAIRQLAGVASLWRHYIPQRLQYMNPDSHRQLGEALELSSRISSQRLPSLLNRLDQTAPNAADAVFATSMFGTGVDVSRLSLMVVHDQPKTTSSYIQATGRVGRNSPALVVTAYSPTRPRSLDHYEFFAGYHQQLYRGVEPVTVYPFAPRARERAFGPMLAALLRQLRDVPGRWRKKDDGARAMGSSSQAPEVEALLTVIAERAERQPEMRKPSGAEVMAELEAAVEKWRSLCEVHGEALVFEEYTLNKLPERPVVLGDPQHTINNLPAAFPNAPQSLREIEPTTGFQI